MAASYIERRWFSNGLDINCITDRGSDVHQGLLRPRGHGLWRMRGNGTPGELAGEMLVEVVCRATIQVGAVPAAHTLEFLSNNGGSYIAAAARALARLWV